MIDHVIACGWNAVDMFNIRRRQFSNIPPSESEPEFKKYLDLFNKIVPTPTFDNLPIPKIAARKVTQRIQPPSYISSDRLKEYYDKKKKMEREGEAKKKEVEEKKARAARNKEEREKEKRNKAEERNQKKLEKERLQLAGIGKSKGKGKGKGKKRKQEESSDEEERQKIVVVYDDRSDEELVEEIDESTCDMCKSDRDLDGWIGCECGRWFHKRCTGKKSEFILGMDEEEMSEYKFLCFHCE